MWGKVLEFHISCCFRRKWPPPPKPLKAIGITMVSGRGRGKTQLSTKKVTFGAPGGVFWWFSWKNHDFLTFPHFWWKGHLSAPPYAKPCYGNAFQWFWGVQFHPSRGIMLFPVISQYFHYFHVFHEKMWKFRENTKKYQLFAFGADNAPRNPLKTTVITMVSGGGSGKAPKAPEVEEFKVFYPKIAGLLRISWNFC